MKLVAPILLCVSAPAFGAVLLDSFELRTFAPDVYELYAEVYELGAGSGIRTIDSDSWGVYGDTIGIGFTYYQLPFGTPISQNAPILGPKITSNLREPPPSTERVDIPIGSSVFLAFEFASDVPKNLRTYGWVELQNDAGRLSIGESAMASNEIGIIVGTTTAIPETSTFLPLALFSLLFLHRRQRGL